MGVPPLCLIRTKNINEKQRKTLIINCESSPTINLLFHKSNNNTLFQMFRANHITTCNNNINYFIYFGLLSSIHHFYLLSEKSLVLQSRKLILFIIFQNSNLKILKILFFEIFNILQITSSLSRVIFLILRNKRIISLSRDFTNTK
jgi:hypothetical protein